MDRLCGSVAVSYRYIYTIIFFFLPFSLFTLLMSFLLQHTLHSCRWCDIFLYQTKYSKEYIFIRIIWLVLKILYSYSQMLIKWIYIQLIPLQLWYEWFNVITLSMWVNAKLNGLKWIAHTQLATKMCIYIYSIATWLQKRYYTNLLHWSFFFSFYLDACVSLSDKYLNIAGKNNGFFACVKIQWLVLFKLDKKIHGILHFE